MQSNRIILRSRKSGKGIKSVWAQALLIAYLVLMVFITLLPVIITFTLSLKTEQDISTGSLWSLPTKIQWANYSSAFTEALSNMGITLFIDLVSVFAMTMISTFTAYIFVRKRFPGRNILFYLIILPMLVPGVVSLTPQYLTIVKMGLLGSWWSLILPYVAGNQIASVFLFRTFMAQQPNDIYEAAEIDGAGFPDVFFFESAAYVRDYHGAGNFHFFRYLQRLSLAADDVYEQPRTRYSHAGAERACRARQRNDPAERPEGRARRHIRFISRQRYSAYLFDGHRIEILYRRRICFRNEALIIKNWRTTI